MLLEAARNPDQGDLDELLVLFHRRGWFMLPSPYQDGCYLVTREGYNRGGYYFGGIKVYWTGVLFGSAFHHEAPYGLQAPGGSWPQLAFYPEWQGEKWGKDATVESAITLIVWTVQSGVRLNFHTCGDKLTSRFKGHARPRPDLLAQIHNKEGTT